MGGEGEEEQHEDAEALEEEVKQKDEEDVTVLTAGCLLSCGGCSDAFCDDFLRDRCLCACT